MTLLQQHLEQAGINHDLAKLILLVAQLSKKVSKAFHSHQHKTGTSNVYGEEQLAMDKWADSVFIEGLKNSNLVKAIASEEQSTIISVEKPEGTYGITLDPLDGSSLVDVNLTVGTIVGFFNEGNVLEKGEHMNAALYVMYGPLTVLVYAAGKGVHEFVLNDSNQFVVQRENILIPEGTLYSIGGLRKNWTVNHKKYIEKLEEDGYKLRYSGGFVPDFHQVLRKGGMFTYPALVGKEQGKLRLLFEANPMCLIIRQAGGAATTGKQRIENITPTSLSDRVPLYIGGKKEIEMIEKIMCGQK